MGRLGVGVEMQVGCGAWRECVVCYGYIAWLWSCFVLGGGLVNYCLSGEGTDTTRP
jgi:hypothetical protein